jgi:hypothetical protein
MGVQDICRLVQDSPDLADGHMKEQIYLLIVNPLFRFYLRLPNCFSGGS